MRVTHRLQQRFTLDAKGWVGPAQGKVNGLRSDRGGRVYNATPWMTDRSAGAQEQRGPRLATPTAAARAAAVSVPAEPRPPAAAADAPNVCGAQSRQAAVACVAAGWKPCTACLIAWSTKACGVCLRRHGGPCASAASRDEEQGAIMGCFGSARTQLCQPAELGPEGGGASRRGAGAAHRLISLLNARVWGLKELLLRWQKDQGCQPPVVEQRAVWSHAAR